jgi:hypothetical protein
MRGKENLVRWSLCVLFLLLTVCVAAEGKIIYVDDDAVGLNDGSSWTNAYNYLQDALADASSTEKPVEIHVAQGIYKPDCGVGFIVGNRFATFSLENGVVLRGGFAGFAEPDPNSRGIEKYKTILSGDLAGNDIDIIDPCDLQLFYTPPSRTDNSITVLTCKNIDQTAILDGFTVSSGCWTGETFPGTGFGAGMHNSASSPTLLDCTFTGNICSGYGSAGIHNINGSNPILVNCTFEINYGCGMGNLGSNPEVIDCKFINNFGLSNGGAMYNAGSNPILTRCIFSDNSFASYGFGGSGTIYNYKSNPMLTECIFTRNHESVAIYNKDSSPTLADCIFTENTDSYFVGTTYGTSGIYNEGGQLTVEGCVFEKNYSRVIYDYSKTGSVFTNCTFSGNSALGVGGAIHTYNATFTNCVFSGNRALGYRLNDGTWLSSEGGAVYYFSNYSLTFTNCTFSNNWADFGNSIYCYGLVNLNNCILWSSGGQIYADGPPTIVRYSDVQGGWQSEGNIDAEPHFADPGRWINANDPNQITEPNDPNAVWVDGDYHLKSQAGRWDPISQTWIQDDVTSPCIDAGDPNSPVAFESFPNGEIINMGAYGGTVEASKSYFGEPVCETIIAGDINGDCKVDFADLYIMIYHWMEDDEPETPPEPTLGRR